VDRYARQTLHPSYLGDHPVRGSMVATAQREYNVPLPGNDSQNSNNYLLPGTHKHLGGAYDATDGCIYGVPANSNAVLCLYPSSSLPNSSLSDDEKDNSNSSNAAENADINNINHSGGYYRMKCIELPPSVRGTSYKWLRGIVAHGCLWAIPSWADAVLCVDLDAYWDRRRLRTAAATAATCSPTTTDEIVQLLPLPPEHHWYAQQQQQQNENVAAAIAAASSPSSSSSQQQQQEEEAMPPQPQQWQWHGAGMNKEGTAIFCIPCNARHVLKVDLIAKATSLIPIDGYDPSAYPNFALEGTNKWYGGIVGADDCVYGIPYGTCAVLRIDCANGSATLVGPDYGATRYNWHGGIQVNGKIYAHPSHADTVLVIDTNPGVAGDGNICSELPIHHRAPDGDDADRRKKYKWLGGAVGADGNIYCPACDASAVLRIDTATDVCTTFGFAGADKNKVRLPAHGRCLCVCVCFLLFGSKSLPKVGSQTKLPSYYFFEFAAVARRCSWTR
jgi:hypothetical protein